MAHPPISRSPAAVREPLFTGPFLRLCAFSFITFLAAFQLFPTIPFRILDLGGSRAAAGLFLGVYTWASAISAPLTGALADRLGRRRLLLVAAVAFLVFTILYGVIRQLPVLLAVAALHGVFWSALLSSSGALISEVIPLSRRTEGLAYWGMAPTAAIAIAPAIGLTVYRFGWGALIAGMAAMSVAIVVLALLTPRAAASAEPPGRRKLVHPRVMAAALTISTLALGYGGITSYVAVMSVERGIDPPSLFFTVFAVTILVTRVLVGRAGDRFGPERLLVPSLLAVPPALLALGFADSRAEIVAAGVLFGFGFGGAYPAFLAWVLGRTEAADRAAVFGSVLFALDTAIGTGSLLFGPLVARGGFDLAFAVVAGISTLALPVFLAARRLLPPSP